MDLDGIFVNTFIWLFICLINHNEKLSQSPLLGDWLQRLVQEYLAVLHTWGSGLQYHPHLHLVIPGGALSEESDQWLPSRQDLFVHTNPLSVIFKAKFRHAMKKAKLYDKIDLHVWEQQWVVDSQAVGKGQNSLRYLSRDMFRVAISNNRIKCIENGLIKFQYKNRQKKSWKTMTLDAKSNFRTLDLRKIVAAPYYSQYQGRRGWEEGLRAVRIWKAGGEIFHLPLAWFSFIRIK